MVASAWPFRLVLAGLIIMLACTVAIVLTPEPVDAAGRSIATGQVHPEHSTMRQGGPGVERLEPIFPASFGFVVGMLIFVTGLLGSGLSGEAASRRAMPWFLAWSVGFGAVFVAMILTHRGYAEQVRQALPMPELVFGMPAPTAFMIFGVWFFPLGLVALYLLRFDALVWSESRQAAFDALLHERDAVSADDAGRPGENR